MPVLQVDRDILTPEGESHGLTHGRSGHMECFARGEVVLRLHFAERREITPVDAS